MEICVQLWYFVFATVISCQEFSSPPATAPDNSLKIWARNFLGENRKVKMHGCNLKNYWPLALKQSKKQEIKLHAENKCICRHHYCTRLGAAGWFWIGKYFVSIMELASGWSAWLECNRASSLLVCPTCQHALNCTNANGHAIVLVGCALCVEMFKEIYFLLL